MAMMDDGHEIQELYELLSIAQEKKQKILRIQEITKKQSEFIAHENIDALFKSIEEKDIYIKDIDRLDRKFHLLYEEVEKKYDSGELDNRSVLLYDKLQLILKDIRRIIRTIYEEDSSNMTTMKKLQENYATDIKRIQQGAKRQEAYNPHFPIDGGVFIDQKQ